MSPLQYDTSRWTLLSRSGRWALLTSKTQTDQAMLAEYADGEWELNETGDFEAMRSKFTRVTGQEHDSYGTMTIEGSDHEPVRVQVIISDPIQHKPADPYADNPLFGRF